MVMSRQLLLVAGINLAQQTVMMAASIVVARLMGPTPIGTIAAALALLSAFSFLGDIGLGTAHAKYLAEGRDVGRCMGAFVPASGFLSFVAVAAGLGAYAVRRASPTVPTEIPLSVMLLVALGTLFGSLSMIPRSTFLGLQDIAKRDLPRLATQVVGSGLRIGVAVVGLGVLGLAAADAIAAFLLLVLLLLLLRRIPISRPDLSTVKDYWSFGLPVFAGQMIYSLIAPLDRVLLEMHYGVTEVGIYAVALRLAAPLATTVTMAAPLFLPHLSRLGATGEAGIHRFLGRAERRLAIATVPLFIGAVAVGQPLVVLLLGAEFTRAGPVFGLLVLWNVLWLLAYPYAQALAAEQRMRDYLVCWATGLGLQALLLLAAVGDWGGLASRIGGPLLGTAGALVLAGAMQMVLFRWFARRTLDLKASWRIGIHLASGTACALLAATTIHIMNWTHILSTGAIGVGAVLLHGGILWIASELGKEEVVFFVNMLNPVRLGQLVTRSPAGAEDA